MRLEDIEAKIADGEVQSVTEGQGGKCYVVEIDGEKFLHKNYPTYPPFEGEEARKFARFKSFKFGMPSTCYINDDITAEQRASKEFSTMREWERLGIATPDAVLQRGSSIVYKFMPGKSFSKEMDGETLNEEAFGRVLDCFHDIRRVARERIDIDLLHNDPFVDNFFYDAEREKVVPLDPAKVLVKRYFGETDGRINLFSLCKIFHLNTTSENQAHYLKQAVDRFTSNERLTVSKLNTDPEEARTYLQAMGTKWGAHNLSVYYSRDVLGVIQNALTK